VSFVDLGPLHVNLNEFVKAIKDLISTDLDDKSKKDISNLIKEVRKTYDTIVDSLDPFYNVRIQSDDSTYVTQFTSQFRAFKTMFKKNRNELRTHCTSIQKHMTELLENRKWLSRIPHKKKSLEDLKNFADRWGKQEDNLARILEGFLSYVNNTLDRLDDLNNTNSIAQSRDALRAFMKESEAPILNLKCQLDELRIISNKLV
jgi:hypothetical protein